MGGSSLIRSSVLCGVIDGAKGFPVEHRRNETFLGRKEVRQEIRGICIHLLVRTSKRRT